MGGGGCRSCWRRKGEGRGEEGRGGGRGRGREQRGGEGGGGEVGNRGEGRGDGRNEGRVEKGRRGFAISIRPLQCTIGNFQNIIRCYQNIASDMGRKRGLLGACPKASLIFPKHGP